MNMTTVRQLKADARKEYINIRKSLNVECRHRASSVICKQLLTIEELNQADFFAAYFSDGFEPDIRTFVREMIGQGKRFCFPRYNIEASTGIYEMVEISNLQKDVVTGKFGLSEPDKSFPALPAEEHPHMVWLIPGVAFDKQGGRLGRGLGVYDCLLGRFKKNKIGIFYDCQQMDSVPRDSDDQSLNIIVTEKNIYHC